jgi:hypothetical protein
MLDSMANFLGRRYGRRYTILLFAIITTAMLKADDVLKGTADLET